MSQDDVAPWKRAAALAAVAAVTAACFAPALRNGLLIWDDAGYIWENPSIQRLDLDTVVWAFGQPNANVRVPLTWLSLALDHAVWGLDPFGYHLTNLLLHSANAGLFFLLALGLLRQAAAPAAPADGTGGAAPATRARWALWGAVLGALLYALHPLRVESVAWATERKDDLSLFFGLLATLVFLAHAARYGAEPAAPDADPDAEPDPIPGLAAAPRYWLALGLFVLSLLSKSALVTWPLVLLVLDRFPLRRVEARGMGWLVMEKLPFLLAALVAGLASADAAAPNAIPLSQLGAPARLLNAVHSLGAYLGLTLWPTGISPYYPHPGDQAGVEGRHLLSGAALVAVTVACGWAARRRPWFQAAWLAWLLLLAPFLGLAQVGPQAMAARFTYAAALPLALLAGAGLSWLVLRQPRRPVAVLSAAAAVAGLSALSAVTVRDLATWKDDVTLWTRVIELSPRPSSRAFLERSNGQVRRGDLPAALADADRALAAAATDREHPLHELHLARGMVLEKLGRFPAALAAYGDALQVAQRPGRAVVLTMRSALYRRIGEPALAAEDLAAAASP